VSDAAIVNIKDLLGQGAQLRPENGVTRFFKVAQATMLSWRMDLNMRLTNIRFIGTNTVVSLSGVRFTNVNGATTYDAPNVLAIHTNQTEGQDDYWMNVVLDFQDNPNLYVYVDNGGAAGCYIIFYMNYYAGHAAPDVGADVGH